jgi:hypothetical protein
MMCPARCCQHRQRGARHVDHAVEIRVDLRAEIVLAGLLERHQMAETRIVDHHVEAAVCVDGALHRSVRRRRIGDVQRDRANLLAIARHQILQTARIARRGDDPLARLQRGLDDRAPKAASTSRYQPDFRHDALLRVK